MNKKLRSMDLIDAVGDGLRELRRRLATTIRVQRQIQGRAKIYKGKPIDLLISTNNILSVAASFTGDPSVKKIHKDFYRALKKFIQADAADLGEAFNLQRPKHWNQESEKFWKQKMAGIEIEIDDLRSEMPVMDAIENVANKHCKGVSKIRDDYYAHKKWTLQGHCNQMDVLELEFFTSGEEFGFGQDAFLEWFHSGLPKATCKHWGFDYNALVRFMENNDWEPSRDSK